MHDAAANPIQPLAAALDAMRRAEALGDLLWVREAGIDLSALARARLQARVGHARAHSAFHRRLHASLPDTGWKLSDLRPTTRAMLMAHFDAACTDPEVRRGELERFLADRGRIGHLFLGRYNAWKSSGTSGVPGLFLQDGHAMAVYGALVAAQLAHHCGGDMPWARGMMAGGRSALVIANGDHYASITAWESMRRSAPGATARSFSVLEPLPRLRRQLEAFDPAFLASYPSVLSLLARERRAGRLAISPQLLWAGGENLTPAARREIESAFGCPILNEYGASECLSIAYECPYGCMHLNEEWVMLEAVDRRYRPVPPGTLSDTVLVTNLANRVQPIIRYDLGDRIRVHEPPCRCGDPRMAFHVQGRSGHVIELEAGPGRRAALPPLALETAVEEVAGGRRFQVVVAGPAALRVRLGPGAGRSAAWRRVEAALTRYLAAQELPGVRVELAPEAPMIDPASGKLHPVLLPKGH